ncbi:MAG: glycosyltransferase [Chloroflexi bacterium]|nr:glycosyltransferase [Chloroflexota bacterium]
MSNKQLRIAMLSVHSCPVGQLGAKDTGGMSTYIRELAGELGNQGHSVDVYTRVHDPNDPQIVSLGQNARLIHLKVGDNREIPKLALYSYLPDFADNVENFRKQDGRQYDLVFSHYWLSGLVGNHLQKWWRTPHIIMFHTLGAVKNSLAIGEEEPELRIETEKDLAQNCHRIIAPTEKVKEELMLYCGASPERISVVPCGVNLELFRPMDKAMAKQRLGFTDNKLILFIGRIEPLKGIEQLLRAMPYLPNRQRPRLVIVGGDEQSQPDIEKLKELSRQLHIEESVSFPGLIKHEQTPYFYSAADVCVIPSYYESFGLVALEALACGTPVVATDVGNLKSIIRQGETGYVVSDNTPRHLADKIALLLSQPSPDRDSIATIRASVSQFSWSNIAEAIVRECRLVLANYAASSSGTVTFGTINDWLKPQNQQTGKEQKQPCSLCPRSTQ